ncbi:MAG: nucleoside deaminase [Pseudodesulfovibrio sp.]|uniref:CMP/dCMP deaminase zinc-binding protein n=1 Tax=Pseudodesulfovibrio aespoeensis (strain ATCC 700646 / DSM 10631 / Aspo-2) TaxID=643562 RepID=E6VY38_PSEA9|nr:MULTISPECIES: nucleoside deaminase [Pseudodesulfovibrio]MBU4192737.1 nucleoside deaminase [Pseudomonadota bacterium]ADU63852.1 CMP/dCMP deaminase zinc-binding protein [Pseudodesulfovibrio aespoeensis Aspo-2]MBU4243802.1 nucleoside deaminase [Pseudomonadota bacterium]MBU4379975.1 nucleoside deaminase [Pseudomonadota bacterium]MBU4475273.1 nucleoside deaminase [Pseudomonadota bacterium]
MTKTQGKLGTLAPIDEQNLRAAMDAATASARSGEGPFGAVVAGPDGMVVMTQQAETIATQDHTRHAEAVLASRFCRAHYDDPAFRAGSTLYSSMEPCAMCMFAMFKAGIGRLVYGLSAERLYSAYAIFSTWPRTTITSHECVRYMSTPMVVQGPFFEDEGLRIVDESFRTCPACRG